MTLAIDRPAIDRADAPLGLFSGKRPSVMSGTFVYIILWASVLRPFPNILVGSVFGISRLLDLLALAFMLSFFVSGVVLGVRIAFPRGLAVPMLAFTILSVLLPLAHWNSAVLHNEPTGIRDFFELLRFPMMMLTLLFLAQGETRRENIRDYIEWGFIIPFWIVAFLCLAEIIGIPVVASIKSTLWAQSKNTLAFNGKYFRISGTLENPNWFSLYVNMILAIFLFFRTKGFVTVGGILTCICFVALTGSLTGAAGLVFLAMAYFLSHFRSIVVRPVSGIGRLLVMIVFICAGLYAVQGIGNARLLKRLERISSGGIRAVESANVRVTHASSLTQRYMDEPRLLGFGPSKYFVADVIDNQYVEYLIRYGIIGSLLLLWTYGYYCIAAFSLWVRSLDRTVKDYCVLICVVTVLLLMYCISGQFADIPRLSFVYLGLVVPVCGLSDRKKRRQVTRNARA